jgi:hypothetical protein
LMAAILACRSAICCSGVRRERCFMASMRGEEELNRVL